jgi:hypothetical protein
MKEEEEKRKLRAEVLGKEYVDFSDDSEGHKDDKEDSETDQEESSKADIGYERDRAASEKKLKEK